MLSTTALNFFITNKIKDWHPGHYDEPRQLNRFRRIVFARLAPLDPCAHLETSELTRQLKGTDGGQRFSGSVTFVAAQGKVTVPQLALNARHLKRFMKGARLNLL